MIIKINPSGLKPLFTKTTQALLIGASSLGLLLTPLMIQADETAIKPRVFVLTDIENEPDDAQSLVRFLVYSNQWDVEGLIATTSIHQQDRTAAPRIRRIIKAYGQVRGNLLQHEKGFPTEQHLLSVVGEGLPDYGMNAVGKSKDSAGSEALITAVDKNDSRPLWVTVWGGPNVLAQALWKVRETRSKKELAKFVSKIRVYTISDQDDSGPWIRTNFPSLHYIASPGFHSGGGYHYATWSGIAGDNFHARFDGGNFALVDNPWLDKHIRSKGPLGAEHPHTEYLMEGDTPSFLGLINNGLNNMEHPNWGGWGGRYEFYTPRMTKWLLEPETRPLWTNTEDEVMGHDGRWHTSNHATIWRWREAFQHDFSARMDWTIKSYDEANHPPIAKVEHATRLTAKPGERVDLSAVGSSDPDGDSLSYQWFYYAEPGTFTVSSARTGQPLDIKDYDQPKAWFKVPTSRVLRNGTMHIILAVTDHGTPRLTRYQRVIVDIKP
ncbi:MAG: nucleoside hydrolase-like domain-containing protein [Paraglaciecola sp.]|uniref:nucleoside hydrolase-like domain-containing protein n=1 Tax=Paraglaciecola sp. TaxID=1920173 RepID=UPI0032988FA9